MQFSNLRTMAFQMLCNHIIQIAEQGNLSVTDSLYNSLHFLMMLLTDINRFT